MVERDTYPEIEHTIDAYGGYWKKTQDLRFESKGKVVAASTEGATKKAPRRGDVDFAVMFPTTEKGAIIEVKYKRHNFAFAEIRPEQRDVLARFGSLSWLWLFMGDRIGGKEYARRAWLIPWIDWLRLEEAFRYNELEGIAYDTPHKLEHREMNLSAVDYLPEYELKYDHGIWVPQLYHPFLRVVFCQP